MMYLTEKEAAKCLGMSWRTMSKWRMENKGPIYYKFEGAVRYSARDIALYAASNKVKPL